MPLASIKLIAHGVRRVERISNSNGFHHVITQLHRAKLHSLYSFFLFFPHLIKGHTAASSTGIQIASGGGAPVAHLVERTHTPRIRAESLPRWRWVLFFLKKRGSIRSKPGLSVWCGEGLKCNAFTLKWLCKPTYDETAALG